MTKQEAVVSVRISQKLKQAIEAHIYKGEEYIYPSSELFDLLDSEGFVSKDWEPIEAYIHMYEEGHHIVCMTCDLGPDPDCEVCNGICHSNDCDNFDRIVSKTLFHLKSGMTFLPTTREQDEMRRKITYTHRLYDPAMPGYGYFEFIELLNSLTADELINLPKDFVTWSWNISQGVKDYKSTRL